MDYETLRLLSVPTSSSTPKRILSDNYGHFRKVLKSRYFSTANLMTAEKFHRPSLSQERQTPKIMIPMIKPQTESLQVRRNKKLLQFQTTGMSGLTNIVKLETDTPSHRSGDFYSLEKIQYKNYKYQKPPCGLSTQNFLEGSLKLGQKMGVWKKSNIVQKFDKPENVIVPRATYYRADHLDRSRRPQGPQSCLETIYISKIKLDEFQDQRQIIQNVSNTNERQNKLNEIQENLQAENSIQQVHFPSQAYILNKWMRENRDLIYSHCSKRDEMTKYTQIKTQIQKGIAEQDKIVNDIMKSKQESEGSIMWSKEMSKQFELPKFQPIRMKQNTIKSKYIELVKEGGKKVLLLGTLVDNFPAFSEKRKLIAQRLLISLSLPDPFTDARNLDVVVPFKTFEKFHNIYISKKANLEDAVDAALNFFQLFEEEPISTQMFLNILKLLCDNFPQKDGSIFNSFVENFTIAGVLGQKEDPISIDNFRAIFLNQNMHIYDLTDFIYGIE